MLYDETTKQIQETVTIGFNPFFHDEWFILNEVFANPLLRENGPKASHVYFYCAGGSSKELQMKVARGLYINFKNADIKVDHDLDGAAYATCDGRPGIACILGTGSNSCYFDGEAIHEEVPALAYILGDEGSGSYYGKMLLRDYFYKRMPENIRTEFETWFKPTKEEVFDHVYMRQHANVYLASFMRFCSEHKKEQYIIDMVDEGMYDFLNTHVCCYKNYKTVPTHFVGSIAFYFEELLRKHAANLGIQVGRITNKPVEGLLHYHLKKLGLEG